MENKGKVGYTAGVYDMFHVGHLNLLINAKKKCDYLIVGVNSDDATYKYKNKYPVIPESERLRIVESIKGVDEAVIVENTDKTYAYDRFNPDVIIVGDDHKGEQKWIDLEKYMGPAGGKVEYLPYTGHTSSTRLRNLESERVMEYEEQ